MSEKKIIEKIEEVKTFTAQIIDVYEDSVIIMVSGWRMHVYLDLKEEDFKFYKSNKLSIKGRNIQVAYIGDLKDPFTLKVLPLKNL